MSFGLVTLDVHAQQPNTHVHLDELKRALAVGALLKPLKCTASGGTLGHVGIDDWGAMGKSTQGRRRELIAAVVGVSKAQNLKGSQYVPQLGDIEFRRGLGALRRDRQVQKRIASLDIGKPMGREVW